MEYDKTLSPPATILRLVLWLALDSNSDFMVSLFFPSSSEIVIDLGVIPAIGLPPLSTAVTVYVVQLLLQLSDNCTVGALLKVTDVPSACVNVRVLFPVPPTEALTIGLPMLFPPTNNASVFTLPAENTFSTLATFVTTLDAVTLRVLMS